MTFENCKQSVAAHVKTACQQAGFTQMDVQRKIGISYRHYQDIEAAKVNPTLETLCRLASAFGTRVRELVKRW